MPRAVTRKNVFGEVIPLCAPSIKNYALIGKVRQSTAGALRLVQCADRAAPLSGQSKNLGLVPRLPLQCEQYLVWQYGAKVQYGAEVDGRVVHPGCEVGGASALYVPTVRTPRPSGAVAAFGRVMGQKMCPGC